MAGPKIKNRGDFKIYQASKPVPPVLAYVDNSNVFIEGQKVAARLRGEDPFAFRIHFANFYKLLARDRPLREVVWGGSFPSSTDPVWDYLKTVGITPSVIDRAPSGENETVDHFIQLPMHRHVGRIYRDVPGTIVLCTGDGKGYHNKDGFLYDVEGFVKDGWELELLSWSHCCHGKLKEFARHVGHFIALEEHLDEVTFSEGGRRALPVDFSTLPV